MMIVINSLNGDEYACFVVLRLGNTIYCIYLNGLNGKFWVSISRDFSRFFQKIRKIISIYMSLKNPRCRESAKIELRSSEGSLYKYAIKKTFI